MIKNPKKTFQKEKSSIQLSNPQKISKHISKPNIEKTSTNKIKFNPLKASKNYTESKYKLNKRNHKSISLKGDENNNNNKWPNKFKTTKFKQNIKYNNTCENNNNNISKNKNNKLFSSNLFLTNDTTDIPQVEEDKKNFKDNKNKELNISELDANFKNNKYKKTIIIDNEGNNNLNLNIKKGDNDYKILINNNNTIISNNTNTETNSLFTNGSHMDIYNNILINNNNIRDNNFILKTNDIKNNVINDDNENDNNTTNNEKSEEEKRIKEYTKIFNLLNTNIEQFKKMFNINKIPNIKNNLKNIKPNINSKNNNKKILIKNKKSVQNRVQKKGSISLNKKSSNNDNSFSKNSHHHNLIKNLSEKNLSSSSKHIKTNQNIFTIDVRNDIEKDLIEGSKLVQEGNNKFISSFLESSIQDEFYQSLMNQTFPNLADEEKIVDDCIMNVNIDEKGQDENIQDIQNSRIFRGKNDNEGLNLEKNEKNNMDKNNCFIF